MRRAALPILALIVAGFAWKSTRTREVDAASTPPGCAGLSPSLAKSLLGARAVHLAHPEREVGPDVQCAYADRAARTFVSLSSGVPTPTPGERPLTLKQQVLQGRPLPDAEMSRGHVWTDLPGMGGWAWASTQISAPDRSLSTVRWAHGDRLYMFALARDPRGELAPELARFADAAMAVAQGLDP